MIKLTKIGSKINMNNLRTIVPRSVKVHYRAFSGLNPNQKDTKVSIIGNAFNAFSSVVELVKNPKNTWSMIKETAVHYWVGSKLLWKEIKIANQILNRIFQGHGMTRRERMQLLRTTTDIFRLVPFAIFVIVPFMEFLLPFALKLFPNMLPSTFQDNLKKEEALKQELQMRLAVAKFMQETLQTMASKKSVSAEHDLSGAKEVIDFVEKARLGEPLSNETVIRIARLFKDELTLANVARPQLVSMCRYMALQPYGADAFLRFQLRTKFKGIKEDDRRILWEGIDSLNTLELRDACSERGMRSYGLTHFKLKNQLQEWLSLSIQKNIPISLLIMSRAFMLTSPSDDAEQILKCSMSSLDSDTINEVVIAVASPGEENTVDMRLRKLDSLQFQNEMIEEERVEKKEAIEFFKERETKDGKDSEKEFDGTALTLSASVTDSSGAFYRGFETSSVQGDFYNDGVVRAEQDKRQELTLYEMQAISDMARGSSVLREKSELAILQADVENVHAREDPVLNKLVDKIVDGYTSLERISVSDNSNKEVDKSLARMKSAVNSMLSKLKSKIDSTEKALGDKLNLLDKDGDGELSSEELKNVIVRILKRTSSLQEAEELILNLDSNKDGRVSLVELLAYIKKKSESIEVEALEAQITQSGDVPKETKRN